MQIVIISTEGQKAELLQSGHSCTAELVWVNQLEELTKYNTADAVLDLLFEKDEERIKLLEGAEERLVIINSMTDTINELRASFIRINGWPTFLKGALIEASCGNNSSKSKGEEVMAQFGKKLEWVPDAPGFVTPRIVAMIINEAYFALAEGVSTAEEIDTAMKLGTAYPYGPIEWGAQIGLQNISTLLHKLAVAQPLYTPAALLVQETDKSI